MKHKRHMFLFDANDGKFEKHVSFCAENIVRQSARVEAWKDAWPNHCEKCEGSGVKCNPGDSVPWGSGSVHLPDVCDPCPACIAPDDILKMKCPRCGKEIYEQVVFTHSVPRKDYWLVEEYGQDGIVESWMEKCGPCPECGWLWGNDSDNLRPGVDGCLCHESNFWGDEDQPGRIQKWTHSKFGDWLQFIWRVPIITLATKEAK